MAHFHGLGLHVRREDVSEALSGMRRSGILDNYGCCFQAMRILHEACPDKLPDVLTTLAKDNELMQSITLRGSVKAKQPGANPASKIRTILPMPCFLALLDHVVAQQIHRAADLFSELLPIGFLECAKKHRQCLDAIFPLSSIIEKSLDNHSKGAVAQQDVKKYCDYLQALKVANWLDMVSNQREFAATLLRIHCCPQMVFHVGQHEVVFRKRIVGMFTGSRSAGAAGRIPMLDMASNRSNVWKQLCFSSHGSHCMQATFVDNLLAPAMSPQNAIALQADVEIYLAKVWQLQIGADSKELLICDGCPDSSQSFPGWDVQTNMKSLGHWLSHDGSYQRCLQETSAAMLRSLYANDYTEKGNRDKVDLWWSGVECDMGV